MKVVHVAAAAIFGVDGRLLISRRHDHLHQGGFWEFPGGKVEAGETVESALCRELHEELGIHPRKYSPLISIPFAYPDKRVLLDVWRVTAFEGEPAGREGQPLRWVAAGELLAAEFPPANRPVVAALKLPDHYMITGDATSLDELAERCASALERGVAMVQLRMAGAPPDKLARAAERLLPLCRQADALLLVNGDPRQLSPSLADGIHLNRHRLASLTVDALADWRGKWIGASCHNLPELELAGRLGADYASLSPVLATASHPDQAGLGWQRFGELVQQSALPVYALGGVDSSHLQQACASGAQGIAAIRAYWR